MTFLKIFASVSLMLGIVGGAFALTEKLVTGSALKEAERRVEINETLDAKQQDSINELSRMMLAHQAAQDQIMKSINEKLDKLLMRAGL
jgi:uncharacterized coiled-coil protein SlyX